MRRGPRLSDRLFSRRVTSFVRGVLVDGLLPPLLRDLAPVNRVIRRLWIGNVPLSFQRDAWTYDARRWREVYEATHDSLVASRRSDTSPRQVDWIVGRVRETAPRTVLDVGSGAGYVASALAGAITPDSRLYLADPYQAPGQGAVPRARLVSALAWQLPFQDGSIDVLVSTHTLEHLPRLSSAFQEFRRVARRILVVVPLQRWSRYSWDLHLHFFPYLEYLPGLLETPAASARVIDGDGCYEFVPTRS